MTTQPSSNDTSNPSITNNSGGVDIIADQVEVGGDVVGRDKTDVDTSIQVGDITNSHDVVIGHGARIEHIHNPPTPPPQPKPIIPFGRNERFVGRDDDLQRLHAALQRGTVGIRPAMLTGMGGIGKTQLAVEYGRRYESDYPGGSYWVNATNDWQAELMDLAKRVGIRADDAPESERRLRLVSAFADFLNDHPDALLIFDNVVDPRLLRVPIVVGVIPTELKCHLLFTTRQRDPDLPFESMEVQVLPESAALELLLDTEARRSVLLRWQQGLSDTEIDAARTICRSLGYLPLAIVLASAYLRADKNITLAGYLTRLADEGKLITIDASGVDPLDLATRHAAGLQVYL